MPRDSQGHDIEVGDLVSMLFTVTSVAATDDGPNVGLLAVEPPGAEQDYLPSFSAHGSLMQVEAKAEPPPEPAPEPEDEG